MRALLTLAVTLLVAAGCSDGAHRYALAETSLPVGTDVSEPNFHSAPDGRVVMSWIERVDSNTHALRIAIRGTA